MINMDGYPIQGLFVPKLESYSFPNHCLCIVLVSRGAFTDIFATFHQSKSLACMFQKAELLIKDAYISEVTVHKVSTIFI